MKIAFLGSPPFGATVFDALLASGRHQVVGLVTKPDKPRGRGMKVEPSSMAAAARERGIPVLQPEKARGDEFLGALRAWGPDALLVASYGEILRQDVLDLAPRGAWNVHASLLPRWRGASPIQAAILAGDAETGVCVQRMVLALDEGDVVHELRTPIGPRETSGELLARLAVLGGQVALEAMDLVAGGNPRLVAQDAARTTYATKIRKEQGLVDWTKDALEVDRLVRAFSPWPGARTLLGGAELGLLDCPPCDLPSGADATPGAVAATKEGLVVACGEGAVRLARVKPSGKGPMDGAAWARGARLEPGARCG
jgi:methionyl-tRNA formyltransferase